MLHIFKYKNVYSEISKKNIIKYRIFQLRTIVRILKKQQHTLE